MMMLPVTYQSGNSYPLPAPSLDERVAQLKPAEPLMESYPTPEAYTAARDTYWLNYEWWVRAKAWLDGIDGIRLHIIFAMIFARGEWLLDEVGVRKLKQQTGDCAQGGVCTLRG
jgi:hypothetical protein